MKLLFKIKNNSLCKAVEAKLSTLKLPKGTVKIIDVTNKTKLKKQYNIKIVPCLMEVSNEDEKEFKRVEGVAVLQEIEQIKSTK